MYKQLCLIRGLKLDFNQIESFEKTILKKIGVRIKYRAQIEVYPDPRKDEIRNDLFFYVHEDDIIKFSIEKIFIGAKWWEDVCHTDDAKMIYPEKFIESHPPMWSPFF